MIEQRAFGGTGKKVGVLGLGTTKFGRNTGVKYPGGGNYALPDDKLLNDIYDLALANGMNLIDTAPAYGIAEERIGQTLGARRDKFFLSTKVGEEFDGGKSTYIFTADHVRKSVERSLCRLRTDYLDCVLAHCSRNDLEELTGNPVFETLAALKQEGKIGAFGASVNSVAAGLYTVDHADAVMVSYNTGYLDERPVIDAAHARGRAVTVKKGLASGHLDNAAAAIRFVTDTPGVASLVIGSINPANILSNINALIKG